MPIGVLICVHERPNGRVDGKVMILVLKLLLLFLTLAEANTNFLDWQFH